jgi:hypothetical protein
MLWDTYIQMRAGFETSHRALMCAIHLRLAVIDESSSLLYTCAVLWVYIHTHTRALYYYYTTTTISIYTGAGAVGII